METTQPYAGRAAAGTPAAHVATLVLAALVGIAVVSVVVMLQGVGYKVWVILLGIVTLPVAIAVTGRPKELLLFGWVFSLTYNRQYFAFEWLVGYNGIQGPYVMLSDFCLLGLFAWWTYERITQRTAEPVRGPALWPAYMPFAAICFLSMLNALRPDWAAYEMIRIAKIGLVLFYVRRNVGRREWRAIVAGLGAAVCFQSAVAMKEIITGRPGVIGMSHLSSTPAFLTHFEDGSFTGMVRGVGTMAHPPYLSCYLLLVLPVLLAIALTAPRPRAQMAAMAFLIGCGGLVATLSRWPWMVAGLQVGMVLFGLVLLRQVAVQRALGAAVLATFVLGLALIPLRQKVMHRLTGDFSQSVQYREKGMRASLAAIEDHPLLGLGPNNTAAYLSHYLPSMAWALVTEKFASETLHLRAPVTLGDGILHVAEETGILGLLAFLLFVGRGLLLGVRAVAQTAGEHQAVCLGMLVGLLGVLAEQVIDTPLWVDPVLFSFVLFIGLLNIAPALFGREADVAGTVPV